jgi:maltose-binding protein MalE
MGSGAKVIRVAHSQLEPGFREALDFVMTEYNQLPHVQEAGVRVEQNPISERVYAQFMNVHLISGTAPDIAVKRETDLIKGNAMAKFFSPLGNYVEAPNRYNQPEYQADDISAELSQYLADTIWRDTFFDGLQGGYEEDLSDYYAIPICTWGGFRMIYNLDMLKDAKAFALKEASHSAQPEWMRAIWRSESNPEGFIPEASGVDWLGADTIPQTLGQLILYCYAVQAYADAIGHTSLSPIAGSSYIGNDVIELYRQEFLSSQWEDISFEIGATITPLEKLVGYTEGAWGFDTPSVRAYFDFMRVMAGFYPRGFLGLYRAQAQRRFVLGEAAILSTGGWDATSIYQGVAARDNPEDRFEIAIAAKPLPTADERWSDLLAMRGSEADTKGGVPFAVNKQSPHFDWALDFLKFISSHRMNEQFAAKAGWLPVISSARLPEDVKAFMPTFEGMSKGYELRLNASGLPSGIRNEWSSSIKLYKVGDLDYDELEAQMNQVIENPQIGAVAAWKRGLLKEKDKSQANQRSISVERLNAMLGSAGAARRERSMTYLNLLNDEGVRYRHWWHQLHPDQPYPEY